MASKPTTCSRCGLPYDDLRIHHADGKISRVRGCPLHWRQGETAADGPVPGAAPAPGVSAPPPEDEQWDTPAPKTTTSTKTNAKK